MLRENATPQAPATVKSAIGTNSKNEGETCSSIPKTLCPGLLTPPRGSSCQGAQRHGRVDWKYGSAPTTELDHLAKTELFDLGAGIFVGGAALVVVLALFPRTVLGVGEGADIHDLAT